MIKTLATTLTILLLYHFACGALMVWTLTTLPVQQPSALQALSWASQWPRIAAINFYAQSQAVGLLAPIRETLDELNSGRWERKPLNPGGALEAKP